MLRVIPKVSCGDLAACGVLLRSSQDTFGLTPDWEWRVIDDLLGVRLGVLDPTGVVR